MSSPSRTPDCSWLERRVQLFLECRECEVICEYVVSPDHCLSSGCRFVYVFEDEESAFFGCIHHVFAAQLDLAPYRAALERRERGPEGKSSRLPDVYGQLRARRAPRRECRAVIEQAYPARYDQCRCSNPHFFAPGWDRDARVIRLTSRAPGDDLGRNSS